MSRTRASRPSWPPPYRPGHEANEAAHGGVSSPSYESCWRAEIFMRHRVMPSRGCHEREHLAKKGSCIENQIQRCSAPPSRRFAIISMSSGRLESAAIAAATPCADTALGSALLVVCRANNRQTLAVQWWKPSMRQIGEGNHAKTQAHDMPMMVIMSGSQNGLYPFQMTVGASRRGCGVQIPAPCR